MSKVLTTVALCAFAGSLSIRALDPVLPQIATDFATSIQTAALLSSAFAITYAVMQPVLGAIADLFGKTRLIVVCLAILVGGLILGTFAPTFNILMISRVISGGAAGGAFPIALALVGDVVPVEQRQVAIGRLIGAAMGGNLVGSAVGGVIGDLGSWRWIFVVMALVVLVSCATAVVVFSGLKQPARPKPDLRTLRDGYRAIFANPNAKICFTAVCIEAVVIFGLMPYMAALLQGWGEPSPAIAGIVIGGFAFGGIVYSFLVSRLLPLFGERGMMIGGGVGMALLLAIVALGGPWMVQLVLFIFLGVGFFMLHGSIQVYATELAPQARASAVALHAFSFFVGHALGPLAYGYSLAHTTPAVTLGMAAAAIALQGFACAVLLKPRNVQPV